MKGSVNFTPGPSQLYFTAEDHMRQAFREGIPSLSHRTKTFENIYRHTTSGIKHILGIPDHFHVVFTSSATEIWERIIQNLVVEKSHHFVNGAFSKRFYEIALQLNRQSTKTPAPEGEAFKSTENQQTELIALTHNETSTGVMLPLDFVHAFRESQPESLITVDAVSSLPYPIFDFTKIDSLYFSVQKGFGLPAGLGVWILNDACVTKAEQIQAKGISIGTYHNIPTLVSHAKKNQTPETPNILGIYLLGNVIEDMIRRGIDMIRKETEYKAAILYYALQQHELINPFVQEKAFQSKTVIVAYTGSHTEKIKSFLETHGLSPGDGYGKAKASQLRFANFPAHSKEQFELLVDTLAKYSG